MVIARRPRRTGPLAVAAALLALAACGSATPSSVGAAAPASVGAAAPATAPPAQTAASSSPASASATTAAPASASAAGSVKVSKVLTFSAPKLGGGTLEGASLAGKPVAFWFWAPT